MAAACFLDRLVRVVLAHPFGVLVTLPVCFFFVLGCCTKQPTSVQNGPLGFEIYIYGILKKILILGQGGFREQTKKIGKTYFIPPRTVAGRPIVGKFCVHSVI
jgi:hypothetical protein